ncbi:MAG: alpha/beta hydrolase [Patescibacteria group bacterium]|nr:alpha/beta hydrolase [Patescibacteria group bacterium]
MKRVFIIHGWEADPGSNWFPWLKDELIKKGIEAEVPTMPNSAHPLCAEWVAYLKKIVGKTDKDTFLVGHSLGVIAILRYLESMAAKEKIGGAILVAGFPEPLPASDGGDFSELNNFFAKPLDYEKIKNNVSNRPTPPPSGTESPLPGRGQIFSGFVAIHSDNDPYVPLANGKILQKKLGAELIVISGGGHLNAGDGFFQFPLVLEKILRWTNN